MTLAPTPCKSRMAGVVRARGVWRQRRTSRVFNNTGHGQRFAVRFQWRCIDDDALEALAGLHQKVLEALGVEQAAAFLRSATGDYLQIVQRGGLEDLVYFGSTFEIVVEPRPFRRSVEQTLAVPEIVARINIQH